MWGWYFILFLYFKNSDSTLPLWLRSWGAFAMQGIALVQFLAIKKTLYDASVLDAGRTCPTRDRVDYWMGMCLWIGALATMPIIWVVLRHTPLYNGYRHLLFVVPFLSVLAAVSAAHFFQARLPRLATIGAALVLVASALIKSRWRANCSKPIYCFKDRCGCNTCLIGARCEHSARTC